MSEVSANSSERRRSRHTSARREPSIDGYPRGVMSAGWFFLAAMIGMYGVANLLQSVAAAHTTAHDSLDPKLLLRLARHKVYLVGLCCQMLGFVLAFLARRDLPLFLVQSAWPPAWA